MTIKKLTAIVALLAATTVGCSGTSVAPLGEVGAAATGETSAPPPAPAPDPGYSMGEQVYLDTLASGGIAYTTDDAAIAAGVAVCDFLRAGGSGLAATDVVMSNTGYSPYESGYIVGAAQGALCPDMVGA